MQPDLEQHGSKGRSRWGGTHSVPYLVALLLLAGWWRLDGITEWPMAWHPMLQYENALNTRSLWYRVQGESAAPEARQWLTGYSGRWKGLPVVESVTAGGYLLLGREEPWLAGSITTAVWLLACALFHHIAQHELQSSVAALTATSLLAFHSLGIVLSRSFQHEAMALLGLLIAWWSLWRWEVQASWRHALLVALIAGLALLTKPGVMWLPWCGLLVQRVVTQHGWRSLFTSPRWFAAMMLALVPSIGWTSWLLPGEGHQWKLAMLLTPEWYAGTAVQLGHVLGWLPLVLLLVVTVWEAIAGRGRFVIMVLGCLAYLMLFCYAALTHEYYLLPLLQLTCLALGWLLQRVSTWLPLRWHRIPSPVSMLLAVLVGWSTAQLPHWLPSAGADYQPMLTSGPYRPYAAGYQALGQQLGSGTPVLALSLDYAMPLRYYGHVHAQWWPTQLDLWYERLDSIVPITTQQRMERLLACHPARYFLVTLPEELEKQPELLEVLRGWEEVPCVVPGWRVWKRP